MLSFDVAVASGKLQVARIIVCSPGSIAGDQAGDEVIQAAEDLVFRMLRCGAVEGARDHFNSLGNWARLLDCWLAL